MRDIITAFLHGKPECRPTIDDALEHDFFLLQNIPTFLPVSCLTEAPVTFAYPSSSSKALQSHIISSHLSDNVLDAKAGDIEKDKHLKQTRSASANSPFRQIGAAISIEQLSNSPMADRHHSLQRSNSITASDGAKSSGSSPQFASRQNTALSKSVGQSSLASLSKTQSAVESPSKRTQGPRTRSYTRSLAVSEPQENDENARNLNSGAPFTNPLISPICPQKTASTLEELHNKLSEGLMASKTQGHELEYLMGSVSVQESKQSHPNVFISKWIDYSNKYGLGYQLRDGSVGVYFNDATSIILSANGMYRNDNLVILSTCTTIVNTTRRQCTGWAT